jgi:hypothetical protein
MGQITLPKRKGELTKTSFRCTAKLSLGDERFLIIKSNFVTAIDIRLKTRSFWILKFLLLSKITPEYRTDSLSQASFSAITNEDSSTDLLFDSTVYSDLSAFIVNEYVLSGKVLKT